MGIFKCIAGVAFLSALVYSGEVSVAYFEGYYCTPGVVFLSGFVHSSTEGSCMMMVIIALQGVHFLHGLLVGERTSTNYLLWNQHLFISIDLLAIDE